MIYTSFQEVCVQRNKNLLVTNSFQFFTGAKCYVCLSVFLFQHFSCNIVFIFQRRNPVDWLLPYKVSFYAEVFFYLFDYIKISLNNLLMIPFPFWDLFNNFTFQYQDLKLEKIKASSRIAHYSEFQIKKRISSLKFPFF